MCLISVGFVLKNNENASMTCMLSVSMIICSCSLLYGICVVIISWMIDPILIESLTVCAYCLLR